MKLLLPFMLFANFAATVVGEDRPPPPGEPPPPAPAGPAVGPNLPATRDRSDPSPPGAWLGCILNKPEPSAIAQIPTLPPGMGLVVRGIAPGGPAETAKLEMMDVLWKLDDQLLVNQSQLAALLNLKHPGDNAVLAVFRAGKSIEIPIKLGAIPAENEGSFKEWRDRALLPPDVFGGVVVERGDRTATYNTDEGKAVVKREGEGYRVTIHDSEGKQLLDSQYQAGGKWEGLPDGWHRRVWVLRRSLDHAMENALAPVRPPRPRIVPAPENQVPPPAAVVSPPGDGSAAPMPSGGASKH